MNASPLRSAVVLLMVMVLVPSCRRHTDDNDNYEQAAKAVVSVKVASVVEGEALVTVNAFGRTDALRKEKLLAPLSGRIILLKAYEGSATSKGDVVAVLEPKESEFAVRGAEAMVRTASTPAQKKEAERALRLARSTRNTVAVTAKFDGYVSTRNVSEGELVSENAELMTVIDLASVDFIADVQLHDVPSVAVGQQARVTFPSFPGKVFSARVDAINPETDVQSQTVKIRLRFVQLSAGLRAILKTDMPGVVAIVTGRRSHALFVPSDALLRNDEKNTYSVVTVTKDSFAVSIPVSVGVTTDSTAEIAGPAVVPGLKVITEGNYALPDSTRVTITQQDKE
jgi:multidrug efflux pump subunit AcrA (membrane-fusion protein)